MILSDETTPMPAAAEFSFQQYVYGTGGCGSLNVNEKVSHVLAKN